MAIGFRVKYYWYQVGTGDFLHSFFSTICYHLENKEWGSKYKYLMNDLYNGHIGLSKIDDALRELDEVFDGLSKLDPSKVVWDIDNLNLQTPWGSNISPEITNLGNYFITSEGDDLIATLRKALLKAKSLNSDLSIESI